MTPREFLSAYQFDRRMVTGGHFPSEPLQVEEGDTVGVVLLNLGGPEKREDVAPFLYNLFMDPAIIDLPVGGVLRHWLAKVIAKTRARSVGEDYEAIGGGSPINRLTREQASGLEWLLNDRYGSQTGASFRTYIAMRYWHPFSEEAARQMEDDEVDKVVLLPLYPQYSKTTTGASLVYWKALEEAGEIPQWPTTFVQEYAANPKYVQAVSERIDEGLQRFERAVRPDVQLLFSAHGTPLKEMKERRDPYCCLVHSTVDQLMKRRGHDRPYHVAFQSKVGPAEWLTPSTLDKIDELAEQGRRALLVVPIAFVTDHIETSYELDIEAREEAEDAGVRHFEVTSGLNSHPLFIEALAEATVAQIQCPQHEGAPVSVNGTSGGNGRAASENGMPEQAVAENGHAPGGYRLQPLDQMPRYAAARRQVRCHQCECITEARCWTAEPPASPASAAASGEEEAPSVMRDA
jgi:ferrochelatase